MPIKILIGQHLFRVYIKHRCHTLACVTLSAVSAPGVLGALLYGLALQVRFLWGRYKRAGHGLAYFAALVPLRDYRAGSVPCREPCCAAAVKGGTKDTQETDTAEEGWRRQSSNREGVTQARGSNDVLSPPHYVMLAFPTSLC